MADSAAIERRGGLDSGRDFCGASAAGRVGGLGDGAEECAERGVLFWGVVGVFANRMGNADLAQ